MTTQRQHRKAKAKMYETCIVCGKPKQIPKHVASGPTPRGAKARKPSTYVDPLTYQRDPYCSTVCCKLDHGVGTATAPTSS